MVKKATRSRAGVTARKKNETEAAGTKSKRFAGLKPNPAKPDSDRRERQAARLAQLLRVLEILQSRGKWNVAAIAKELDCSQRTIYRHFKTLDAFGIHALYDPVHECYSLLGPVRFPSLNVTEDEALGQATATAISKASGLDIGAGARPVSRKLAVKSDDNIAQILDDGERLFLVMGLQLANHRQHRDIVRIAQWALLKHRKLVGVYKSPYKAEPQKLELSPWRICLIKQAWYLIARPSDSTEPRTYRLARFQSLRMTSATALQPADFDLQAYFGEAWAVYRGDTRYDVEIRFRSDAADLVTETQWHRSQTVKRNKDGTATLTFRVDGLDEIVHWVLGWSNRATVIRPPELRKLVKDRLQQALSHYD